MEIKVKCPNCRQKYDADESFIGQEITCQVCGAKFRLDDLKTRCMSCNRWFNVQDYNGAVKCPHCGQTTGKHTPEEISGWDAAAEKKLKSEKREKMKLYFQAGIMLFVLGLIVWGLVSCFQSCRGIIKENEAREAREGTIGAAILLCEQTIRDNLKAPSTAKISFETKDYNSTYGHYNLSGYVDAQNGFGAMIRSRFTAVISYNPETGQYHVDVLTIQ